MALPVNRFSAWISAWQRHRTLTRRLIIAILGGYVLAALCSLIPLALPMARTEAVILGAMLSFPVYVGFVIWVFGRTGSASSQDGAGGKTGSKAGGKSSGLRQRMAGLHGWAGLLLGWLLYAIFLTGSASYFREEISLWTRPAIPPVNALPDSSASTNTHALSRSEAPVDSNTLPNADASPHAGAPPDFDISSNSNTSLNTDTSPNAGASRKSGSSSENTEIPKNARNETAAIAQRLVDILANRAPDAQRWVIKLPTDRVPVAEVSWSAPPEAGQKRRSLDRWLMLDPATGAQLPVAPTQGGDFFYRFHYNLHHTPVIWGRWIVGLCAMFMLVAIISGIITHKKILTEFFTFRWGKGQRSWLDGHNGLAVLALPFHLIIAFTGLLGLMLLYMPWGAEIAFRSPAQQALLRAQFSSTRAPEAPDEQPARLAPVASMVQQLQERWPEASLGRITINNPGRRNALVTLSLDPAGHVSESPRALHFRGVDGQLIDESTKLGPAAETHGVLIALHTGRFADPGLRWIYLLLGLGGAGMVGSGLVLWTVKRRAKLPDPQHPHLGFWLVERLNIATITGLPIAMAGFLAATRLLPAALAERPLWEVRIFFISWAALALHALLRTPRRAWIEQLSLAATLLATLPLINALTSDRGLIESLSRGDRVFAGFDLTLLALSALMATIAWRTARHQPRQPAGKKAKATGKARAAGQTRVGTAATAGRKARADALAPTSATAPANAPTSANGPTPPSPTASGTPAPPEPT